MDKSLEKLVMGLSSEDIDGVYLLLKRRQIQLDAVAAGSFSVGDTVLFEGRRGVRLKGKVTQITVRKLYVETPGICGRIQPDVWTVSPSRAVKEV